MKTVLYKVVGFVLTDEVISRFAARICGKDDRYFIDSDPKRRVSSNVSCVIQSARMAETALQIFHMEWPDDHPRAKLGRQWMVIIRLEPSLTETPGNLEQVPLQVYEEEDDKRAVEWLKRFKYSDEEMSEMWMTVPHEWIPAFWEYPLIHHSL